MRRTVAALSVRSFAVLWAGSLGATIGFFMSTVTQAIVAFELTGRSGPEAVARYLGSLVEAREGELAAAG